MSDRTLTTLILKSVAIRLVVALSHFSLLVLRGHAAITRAALVRLVFYTLFPFVPIIDYFGSLFAFVASSRQFVRQQSFRCFLLQLADYHIPLQGHPTQIISLRLCNFRRIVRHPKSSDGVRLAHILRSAKLAISLSSFALSVLVFILVVRRIILVLHSWFNLDLWNGVAALGGAIASFLCIVIVIVGPLSTQWTYPADDGKEAKENDRQSSSVTSELGLPHTILATASYGLTLLYSNWQYLNRDWARVFKALLIRNFVPWMRGQNSKVAMGVPMLVLIALMAFAPYRKTSTAGSAFWVCFAIIPIYDLYYQYSSIAEELRHANLGYLREVDHNWIWRDEWTDTVHVY